ncbi:MAG: TetR/AcrR family transcriptional regulator [Syntrophomonadaceae bacterium]|jgi:AcrR family transcriptional regulator|nr:TetR/AcrR family transcriptional regulator [Syntrophomonadaceae bacterium]
MNGYERRTKQKKDKIRTAALELFCKYGPDKTSINEIAQQAGVSPASIFNYFGSKEGLMKDTIIDLLDSSWKLREELWESELPFPELLKRTVTMKNEFFDTIDLSNFLALINSNPEIKKHIDDFNQKRYPQLVRKFIEKGRREGYIRKEISFEAAMIYLTMYQELLQRPELQQKINNELLKELLDLMIYGLAGQPVHDGME